MMDPHRIIIAQCSENEHSFTASSQTDETVAVLEHPIMIDGVLHLPCSSVAIITPDDANADMPLQAIMGLSCGKAGIATALSTTQLRRIADTLLRIAIHPEARAAEQAAAAITRAGKA